MKLSTHSLPLFLLVVGTTVASVHGKERGTSGTEGGADGDPFRAVRGGAKRRTTTKLSTNLPITGDQKFDALSLRRQLDEQIIGPLMTSGHAGQHTSRRMNGVSASPSMAPSSSGKGKKGGKGKMEETEPACDVQVEIDTCIDEEDCTECVDFDRSKCERKVAIQYTISNSKSGSGKKGGKGKGDPFTVFSVSEVFSPTKGLGGMDQLCPIVEETHAPLDFAFPGPGESITVTKKYDVNICKCNNFVFSVGVGAYAFPDGELGTCVALEGELYQTLPAIRDPEDCTEERVISPLARDVTGEEAFCIEELPDPVRPDPAPGRALQLPPIGPLTGGSNAYAWANDFNEECGVGFIVNSRGTVGALSNDPSEPSITVRNAFGDELFEGFLTAADFPESSPNLGVRAGLVVGCKVS